MPAFRGKKMPWEKEDGGREDTLTHGEKAGMLLCTAMLLFSISDGDVPLGFLSASFLAFEGYRMLDIAGGEAFHPLSAFLRGLCLALAAGSVLMLFT